MEYRKALNNISPYIRRAWDGNMMPGWELKERVIFDYELIYIMEGNAIISIEDRTYWAAPGEVYILRPGVRHSMAVEGTLPMRQPHIHFDLYYREDSERVDICYRPMDKIEPYEKKYFREDINLVLGEVFPERIVLHDREIAEGLMFDIISEMEHGSALSFLKLKASFIRLLAEVLSEAANESSKNYAVQGIILERINSIAEYIRLNYRGTITIKQLSSMKNISASHLQRQFKKVFGVNPIRYQHQLKMEKAGQMVKASHETLTEISNYLGFSDIQHFSKAFRKHFGECPSIWRKQAGALY